MLRTRIDRGRDTDLNVNVSVNNANTGDRDRDTIRNPRPHVLAILLSVGIMGAAGLTLGCSEDTNPQPPSADASTDGGTLDATGATDGQTVDGGDATDGTDAAHASDAGDAGPIGGEDAGDASSIHPVIPGLTQDVRATFDDEGVLHLTCATDEDCFAAEGYFHAAQRFGQMDLNRRFAQGRLAEILGALALDQDYSTRQFIATRTGDRIEDALWAAADEKTKAIFEAYATGVNAWIEDLKNGANEAQLTDEWKAYASRIEPWSAHDSISVILSLVTELTNFASSEIYLGQIFSQLPPDVAFDVFGVRPAFASAVLTDFPSDRSRRGHSPINAKNRAAAAELRAAQVRLRTLSDVLTRGREFLAPVAKPVDQSRGSNNWIVAASRTADGHAIMANDPHLELSNPSIWYLASLDAKTAGTGTVHIAGVSMPGLPGILLGQNEDIAWGATVTYFDATDVYVETLNAAGDAVIFNGHEVPIVRRDFTFKLPNGQTESRSFEYVPHHGPVVSKSEAARVAVSVRWTGQDMTTDLNLLAGLFRAKDLSEAKAAISHGTNVGQNFIVATRGGETGWFPYNRIPTRPWASMAVPTWLPLPGDGSAEWGEWVPYSELPQAENPAAGYLATANNDMTGALADGDPSNDGQPVWQGFTADGIRHQRIVDRLAESAEQTIATAQALQADTYSLVGERCLPTVIDAAEQASAQELLTSEGRTLLTALKAWDYTCPTGLSGSSPSSEKVTTPAIAAASIGCTAFHVLFPRLSKRIFGDELAALGSDTTAGTTPVIIALTAPETFVHASDYFDDVSTTAVVEDRHTTIVRAVNDAASDLIARLGPNPDDWRWGRIHTLTLRHAVFSSLTRAFDVGPFANDGGLHTVDIASPNDAAHGDFSHSYGPSMRLACAAQSPFVRCSISLPGGQAFFKNSPHYADLLDGWLQNLAFPLRFSAQEIEDAAKTTITLSGAN
ncbi:MAG: penicillin acylase family protein [Deltaproteobacteria bacterium]|nr:penicillin acylase family protein [Deltaproteobacteria bacterium]